MSSPPVQVFENKHKLDSNTPLLDEWLQLDPLKQAFEKDVCSPSPQVARKLILFRIRSSGLEVLV